MSDCKKHDYTLVGSDFGQCPLCKLEAENKRLKEALESIEIHEQNVMIDTEQPIED